jgi:hypothetical protein
MNNGVCDIAARILEYAHHYYISGRLLSSDVALKLLTIANNGNYDIGN